MIVIKFLVKRDESGAVVVVVVVHVLGFNKRNWMLPQLALFILREYCNFLMNAISVSPYLDLRSKRYDVVHSFNLKSVTITIET